MSFDRWGCEHEKDAIKPYRTVADNKHDNLVISDNGLVLDTVKPYIGVSPVGLAYCSCCGEGVLEVKCPLSATDKFPESDHESFCMKMIDDHWVLQDHENYYQVQTQMHVCKGVYCNCNLAVWSEKDEIIIDRIEVSNDFFLWYC